MLSKNERAAGAVALVLAVLHQLLAPLSGTDLAAQSARASFAREAPFAPVDFSWYGGVHPFGYSLLSPWIMALLGVGVAGIIAAVLGAVLFARLAGGLQRPMAVSCLGAVFSVADVVSGRTTFALGAVTLLAALLCRERRGWAILFGVLTALLSPVAAAFLGFCGVVLILHDDVGLGSPQPDRTRLVVRDAGFCAPPGRRVGGWTLGLSASLPVMLIGALFPGGGVQPFDFAAASPGLAVAFGLAVVTRSAMVRTGAIVYGLGILALWQHADAFGSNVLRLGLLVSAPLALATSKRGALLVVVVIGSLAWQVDPLHGDLLHRPTPSLSGVTDELVKVGAKRVEVVSPRDHRDSADVAVKVPVARGWGRQIDYRANRLFYDGTLTLDEYRQWIDQHGVDHVVAPRDGGIDFGATREAALLDKPVPWLVPVWQDDDWTVFRVVDAMPIVTGAEVVASTSTGITVRATSPGSHVVKVRWSRWYSVEGPACVTHDGPVVELRFSSAGTARLTSSLRPRGHC